MFNMQSGNAKNYLCFIRKVSVFTGAREIQNIKTFYDSKNN